MIRFRKGLVITNTGWNYISLPTDLQNSLFEAMCVCKFEHLISANLIYQGVLECDGCNTVMIITADKVRFIFDVQGVSSYMKATSDNHMVLTEFDFWKKGNGKREDISIHLTKVEC